MFVQDATVVGFGLLFLPAVFARDLEREEKNMECLFVRGQHIGSPL